MSQTHDQMRSSSMITSPSPAPTSSDRAPSAAAGVDGSGSSTPPVKRRAPIACRRCRRMRSKCIHEKVAPCKSCKEANVPEECVFPSRGEMDQDRQFRHPRQRADRKMRGDSTKVKREQATSPAFVNNALVDYKPPKIANEWDLLPSIDSVLDGVNTFTRHFYQIGFIHKKFFPELIRESPESTSVFLLLSMLCISARFNRSLIKAYGGGLNAANEFLQKAQRLAIQELYLEPTLERCQAFYLLSIAEQGSGKSNTSYISAGIAFRMAALMRLHREEAYSPITQKSPLEHRIRAEAARRTFWMLHSQDNLHSGPYKPLSLAASDITALLPCDEKDFVEGIIPDKRAALEGTPPAIQNPGLVNMRPRSLLATMMQIHNFWGIIARRVLMNEKDWQPHDEDSEYAKLNRRLVEWEKNLPPEHGYGRILLGGYRHYAEDLAYLTLTGCTRLCHIVLRKAHLAEMIRHAGRNPANPQVRFYQHMAAELFCNVRLLYEQIDAHFEDGTPVESLGSQMAAFIVYTTGLLAAYLCKFPQLDAQNAGKSLQEAQNEGRMMYSRTLAILRAYQTTWPLAESWCNGLEKWYEDQNPQKISFQGGTMTDGKEPQPYALGAMHPPIPPITAPAFQNPPRPHGPGAMPAPHPDERRYPTTSAEQETARLAPLQQPAHANYVAPVCLPPLTQAQYIQHHPQHPQHSQPAPHQQQHPHAQNQSHTSIPPPPPQPQTFPPQAYPNPSGLDMLVEASHQTPSIDHYPNAYYADYAAIPLNDGFDNNLNIMVNGGPQWTATDAATAIYNPYGFVTQPL